MTMLETAVTAITPPLRPHETPPEKSCWCGDLATYAILGTAYFYCTRHADATHACYQRWSQIPEGRSAAAGRRSPKGGLCPERYGGGGSEEGRKNIHGRWHQHTIGNRIARLCGGGL